MDTRTASHLDLSSSHTGERMELSDSPSHYQATPDVTERVSAGPPSLLSINVTTVPVSPTIVPASEKRKSLRTRPARNFDQQHGPPPPLNRTMNSQPAQQLKERSSKMSLFNLFSKPKVEKLRGYAEQGLDVPPRGLSNKSAISLKRPGDGAQLLGGSSQPERARHAPSKLQSTRGTKLARKESRTSMQDDRRVRSFDPPPLFQVWPQAIKHGTFEVATLTPEQKGLQRPKNRSIASTLFVPGTDVQSLQIADNRDSIDSRLTTKTNPRNGSISAHLPTKLFVLITSGYLLQYAANGPTNRFPEKILQLGRASAAYASDLIPGKHHVLQVVHSVDQNGIFVPSSGSFFSRLGLRSEAERRSTSNFLLVMSGPEEMGDWMTAIRQEIEKQGGTKRARSGSATNKSQAEEPIRLDLRKVPSLSHRYHVRRDSTIAIVTTPVSSPFSEARKLPLPSPALGGTYKSMSPGNPQDTNTSLPAMNLTVQNAINARPRSGSDTPSASSSTAASEDQQQLEKLRDSTRSSHASTMATPVASVASRANSMSSIPPAEIGRDVHDTQQDYIASRAPYRNLASYSLPKRRSAAQPPSLLKSEPSGFQVAKLVIDSPILGADPPNTNVREPQKTTLSVMHSVPNLKDAAARKNSEALSPPSADLSRGPESFIGDLPDPNPWASVTMPTQKMALQQAHSNPELPNVRLIHSVQTRQLRGDSQSFSIPLRMNVPDATTHQQFATRRSAQLRESGILSPVPVATTLVAKVDYTPSPDALVALNQSISPATMTATVHSRCTPSGRLSLFPVAAAPGPLQTQNPVSLRRTPSLAVTPTAAQTTGTSLKRPASLQVRADHAPFLASVRTSPIVPQTRFIAAAPIRSLKPSRSVATMQTSQSRINQFNIGTRKSADEDSDRAMPLPGWYDGYNLRKARPSGSLLPRSDFGVPVTSLGPPAPPPRAPLPQLPPNSRPVSRAASIQELRSGGPVGVAISPTETRSHTPGPTVGLGIEVGGS